MKNIVFILDVTYLSLLEMAIVRRLSAWPEEGERQRLVVRSTSQRADEDSKVNEGKE